MALRKLQFFCQEVEYGDACHDTAMRARIRAAPFSCFSREGIELELRTGVVFPWRDVSRAEPTLDLGDWSPVDHPVGELHRIRAVLRNQCGRVRGIALRGQLLSFSQGLLAAEIDLSGQAMTGVADALGFLLTVSTRLTSLSMR